jgi:hypothetical protein
VSNAWRHHFDDHRFVLAAAGSALAERELEISKDIVLAIATRQTSQSMRKAHRHTRSMASSHFIWRVIAGFS